MRTQRHWSRRGWGNPSCLVPAFNFIALQGPFRNFLLLACFKFTQKACRAQTKPTATCNPLRPPTNLVFLTIPYGSIITKIRKDSIQRSRGLTSRILPEVHPKCLHPSSAPGPFPTAPQNSSCTPVYYHHFDYDLDFDYGYDFQYDYDYDYSLYIYICICICGYRP